jgi:predicted nucleic acid-binding protein
MFFLDFWKRKQAILEGIQPIGALGILLQAKKIQQIKEIKPLVNKLVENNIRISNALIAEALRLAEETPI